jgi:Mn-dependent DtxR family transcriptional regulator
MTDKDKKQYTQTLGEAYKVILDRFPNVQKAQLARLLGVSRQAVDNAIKRAERRGYGD